MRFASGAKRKGKVVLVGFIGLALGTKATRPHTPANIKAAGAP